MSFLGLASPCWHLEADRGFAIDDFFGIALISIYPGGFP